MTRVLVLVSAVAAGVGATLVFTGLRWFRREPLVARLRRFVPGAASEEHARSWRTFADVLRPIVVDSAGRMARALGSHESAADRLRRIHSPSDPTAFRVRQALLSAAAVLGSGLLAATLGTGPVVTAIVLAGGPIAAFVAVEQRLTARSSAWQRGLEAELPILCEQLAMLFSAGFSLGSALGRLAERGDGRGALDLGRVVSRVRQGLDEGEALREWAALARVPGVERLVGVLALHRDTADLGRLLAEEARRLRAEAHRRLLARIDRRAQLVWIPVTVATLVPGVIFIAVPFTHALGSLLGGP